MSSSRLNLETCRIPLEEIIRATKNFSSETLVGDGGFGMVYTGQLSEHWANRFVAIKRLHPNGYQGNKEFYNELEMVRTFNHPNIIPFIGYSDDADEKIVVYEYATNKSLDRHLQNPDKRRCLIWTQRMKICLGAARGLKYLHSGVGEHRRVIHRDMKSANILLDDNLEANICDFGLSRFSPRDQPDTRVCTRASGTKFYIDPIYNERGRLTKESDIYSFGVVMFEMSTGSMAYDARRFEEAHEQYLIGIVRSTYEEHENVTGLDKLIDPAIRGRTFVSSFHKFHEIAYKCIDLDIKKRPTMDRIIEGIEEALNIQVNLETCRIPLVEIIRATKHFSLETQIGDGGFGKVYTGQLSEQWENRSVVITCLNPNICQGNEEFYNELEMVGAFNHPNIIPFLGYCDDADEKIIVYEYATNKSLDYHLQNQDKKRCLTWTQRLKICLGAARGLKYLHSGVGENRRVIYGDMKSANILLDDNLEAKICDFGLSRFSQRDQPDTRVCTRASDTKFYIDPNYNEKGRLTKESDIYSFGVVMFEMSTGLMAYDARRFEESNEQYLIGIVRNTYEEHGHVTGLDKLMDPAIRGRMYVSSFHKFHEIAYKCIDLDIKERPTMDRIIKGIEEALNIQSFYINKTIEWKHNRVKNIYMCGAKDLTIEWQHDTQHWKWGHRPESRFPEVCILNNVCWLEIQGRIAAVKLSPKCTYVAYLVFQTTENSTGLAVPAETRIRIGGIEIKTENVYLKRPQHVQEDYVLPHRRKDGWMEIKLGEFESNEGDDGEVEMAFKEFSVIWKTGLVVEAFEIRPK